MSDSSVAPDYPVPVSSYTYLRSPIVRQLPNYSFFIDENAYCEFCLQTPSKNSDFYTCHLCSTEFTYWMTYKNYQYLTSLDLFIETQHDKNTQEKLVQRSTPRKYASTSTRHTQRLMTYPGGTKTQFLYQNAHLLCFASSSGHLLKTLKNWIEIHPMMYHVKEQGNDTVLMYTNHTGGGMLP